MTLKEGAGLSVRKGVTRNSQHGRLAIRARSALVLYGSETGNGQDVAEEIGRLTERLRFDTTVVDLDSVELQDLLKHTIVTFVVSTTGQGEFPQNARSFWKVLLSRQLRPGLLRRVNFTSFGLGDSSYPRYNVAHRMLHGRMLQLGAQLFCTRGEGNEQHPEGHTGGFRAWIGDFKDSLLQLFPLEHGQEAVSDDQFVEPKWMLKLAGEDQPIEKSSTEGKGNAADEAGRGSASIKDATDLTVDTPPNGNIIAIRGSLTATLVANPRITPDDHQQDVRLMEFNLPGEISYGPGAVAVIYPKNFPHDVDQFITQMGWDAVADSSVQLVPSRSIADIRTYPPSPLRNVQLSDERTTLRTLLTDHIDIMSIPRRSFFASLAYFTKDGTEDEQYQKERILELANPELIDELWDYTTRPRRTILEVMPDFPGLKIPWQYALSMLPIMRGRQFSIASGGSLVQGQYNTTCVQLLVAIANPPNPIIKYRKRYGVCTRYIASLQAGQRLNISIEPGYLDIRPDETSVPVIMIGPGTGVAPMRSLIYQRLAWAEQADATDQSPLDGSVLFFGCRNRKADYFFKDEWEQLEQRGLKVFAGFSRDKDVPKTYVQDILLAQSSLVYDILKNSKGKVYVCGSSGGMPKGVRQALVEVMQKHGSLGSQEAEAYMDAVEKEGRYVQETW